jgi:SAM-dependent methyltransferase
VERRRYGSLEQGGRDHDRARSLRGLAEQVRDSPRLYLASMSTKPISAVYGFDRGKPADRRWIERFLGTHAEAVHGRCLEVQSDEYVRHFGGDRVTKVEVLDIDPANEAATITADLQDLADIADGTFDCAVVTQTLQYVHEPRRAIAELHRVLVDSGTLLVTLPCLGRVEPDAVDCWRFLPQGARALFAEMDWEVHVEQFGNPLLGVAMWTGMAVEDLPDRVWDVNDPAWPCIVGVRATKTPTTP